MKTFIQWLSERGIRTALGPYPPAYGVGQYPPLYFAPISAAHLSQFANYHGDTHKELLNDPIKKQFEKNKKRRKQRQVGEKKL
jgi:hypothetical protein